MTLIPIKCRLFDFDGDINEGINEGAAALGSPASNATPKPSMARRRQSVSSENDSMEAEDVHADSVNTSNDSGVSFYSPTSSKRHLARTRRLHQDVPHHSDTNEANSDEDVKMPNDMKVDHVPGNSRGSSPEVVRSRLFQDEDEEEVGQDEGKIPPRKRLRQLHLSGTGPDTKRDEPTGNFLGITSPLDPSVLVELLGRPVGSSTALLPNGKVHRAVPVKLFGKSTQQGKGEDTSEEIWDDGSSEVSGAAASVSYEEVRKGPGRKRSIVPGRLSGTPSRAHRSRMADREHLGVGPLSRSSRRESKVAVGKNPTASHVNKFLPRESLQLSAPTYLEANRPKRTDTSLLAEQMLDEEERAKDVVPFFYSQYRKTAILGQGDFGQVLLCRSHMDGAEYAVKVIHPEMRKAQIERTAMNEIDAYASLGTHPNLVRYFTAWREGKHIYIVLEYCTAGTLNDLFNYRLETNSPLTQTALLRMVAHVARGLQFMHESGLAHLDVKPSNVMMSRRPLTNPEGDDDEDFSCTVFKIGDLGCACLLGELSPEDGDSRYAPLEMLEEGVKDLMAKDVFSLGLTAYELASLHSLPPQASASLPSLPQYSSDFMDLLWSMTCEEASNRTTLQSLLSHALMKQID